MAVPTESQLNNVTLTPAQHPLDPLTPTVPLSQCLPYVYYTGH